ncbi:Flagellar L-ring protein [bioreactor metagenome]|uniref:Flagellar L-ring protein n=1 Tax=bioreactor metagenome TaxID=1076179 RepID=A0A645GVL2_9ZZZZ
MLKIKGEKEIKVGKERKKVIVEGLLAASSISSSGTVESSQLAEARIWYDGDVVFQQDPNEKSWISWVLSGISNMFF